MKTKTIEPIKTTEAEDEILEDTTSMEEKLEAIMAVHNNPKVDILADMIRPSISCVNAGARPQ